MFDATCKRPNRVRSSAMEAVAPMPAVVSAAIAVTLTAGTAVADEIHVPEDYESIQEAVDAAEDGYSIIVAPGTYEETIDFLGKTITLISTNGPEVTTIDGSDHDGSVVTIAGGEGEDTLIDGFTITGGTGTLIDEDLRGGGILVIDAALTLKNSIVENNEAEYGGGLYALDSPITLEESRFENNLANDGSGGGARIAGEGDLLIRALFI